VVRDEIDDHAEAGVAGGGAERAELRLAAEVAGDARRVDDVVAVRRAAPRLQDGREVEMGDAELARVRQRDLPRRAKAELLRQLEPVGAAFPRAAAANQTRRSSVNECGSTATSARAPSGPSGASAVASSICQRVPKRRVGSVKTTAS